MLALFAGTGDLPAEVIAVLEAKQQPYVICEMRGFPVAGVGVGRRIPFRIEHLGSVLDQLQAEGVTQVCFAGAVRRPEIEPGEIDAATRPLVPVLQDAMQQGDDGALRAVIVLFEGRGFAVVAAQDLVPDLLPPAGMLVGDTQGRAAEKNLQAAVMRHALMSAQDTGQAVIAAGGRIVAAEGPEGTDAMLEAFAGPTPVKQWKEKRGGLAGFINEIAGGLFGDSRAWTSDNDDEDLLPALGGLLFKAPKLQQDRRADLPVIGPATIELAARCGIADVVIEAGGVMVLHQDAVRRAAQSYGMRIWVREAGA